MKKPAMLILLAVVLFACNKNVYMFTSFHEPADGGLRLLYSYDGYKWNGLDTVFIKPEVDTKVMRDPSIAVSRDGTFHLVWTSAWKGSKSFGYAYSKDLIHWSQQKLIPVMEHEATTVNVWAPEIFYDDEQNHFIIIWASTIPNRFARGIEDEDNNHRMYYTITKDFESFTPAKLYLDPGFSVIDCVIVKRGKEDYVLVLKDNTRPNRNIKVAFSKNPLGPWTKESEAFTPNFTEGPAVLKAGENYLIYYDQYKDKIYGAKRTKDFKTFEDVTKVVSVPLNHKHGTIFIAKKKTLRRLQNQSK